MSNRPQFAIRHLVLPARSEQRTGPDGETRFQCLRPLRILPVDVAAEVHPALRIDPCSPVREQHRNALRQADVARFPVLDRARERCRVPAFRIIEHELGQLQRALDPYAPRAERAPGALELGLRRRVMQLDEVRIRKHQLDAPERVRRAGVLPQRVRNVAAVIARPVDRGGIQLLPLRIENPGPCG